MAQSTEELELKLTDFRGIRFLTSGALRAFVDVVFNDALVVKGFKVIEGKNGLFVAAPARTVKGKDGEKDTYNDIVYFTKASGVWAGFQDQIIEYYKDNIATANSDADI